MQRQSIKPNTISYNVLISACEKSAEPKRALQVFQSMQRQFAPLASG